MMRVHIDEMTIRLATLSQSPFLEGCLINPAQRMSEDPSLIAFDWLFEKPYYVLTADDRANVHPDLVQLWDQAAQALMDFTFDENGDTLHFQIEGLSNRGYQIHFRFAEPAQPLLWVQLFSGIFYLDLASYMKKT